MIYPKDPSKTIRQLLRFASPVQSLLDTLSGPLEGELLQITGGSNSGKSRVALSILFEFNRQGKKLGFIDIENGGFYNAKMYPGLTKDKLNILTPGTQDELVSALNSSIKNGAEILIIDYINLIQYLDYDFIMPYMRDLAKANNVFIMVVTHDRSRRDEIHPSVEYFCTYKVEVSKTSDYQTINMRIIKDPCSDNEGKTIGIPVN